MIDPRKTLPFGSDPRKQRIARMRRYKKLFAAAARDTEAAGGHSETVALEADALDELLIEIQAHPGLEGIEHLIEAARKKAGTISDAAKAAIVAADEAFDLLEHFDVALEVRRSSSGEDDLYLFRDPDDNTLSPFAIRSAVLKRKFEVQPGGALIYEFLFDEFPHTFPEALGELLELLIADEGESPDKFLPWKPRTWLEENLKRSPNALNNRLTRLKDYLRDVHGLSRELVAFDKETSSYRFVAYRKGMAPGKTTQ